MTACHRGDSSQFVAVLGRIRGGRPPAFDPGLHRWCHAVECDINQLKQNRGMATRHDKLAVHFEATLAIAAIDQWLKAS